VGLRIHCALGPFWQTRLGKSTFSAYQASARGGVCEAASWAIA